VLTEDQKKDAERLARYIEREQLVSVMNDTKWQRLFDVLEPIQGSLDFRRKDVRRNERGSERWCSDFYMMLGGWSSIEWLDIRARLSVPRGALLQSKVQDNTPCLIQAVRRAGVRFCLHEQCIRIWGYLRPGVSPHWEE
jgi:hypothetical protein